MIVLGVDGGATKTQAQVADENLKVLGEGFSTGSNYLDLSPQLAALHIKEAIEEALNKAGFKNEKVDLSCLGLAGLDTEEEFEIMRKAIVEVLGPLLKKTPGIVNDTKIAFAAGSDALYGMVLISGTGSNLWAKNEAGGEAFVSGLGHILSGQGSAYEMGLKAVRIAVKSFDRRCEKTVLEDLLTKELRVSDMREAKNVIHTNTFGKSDMAQLAKLVSKAQREGDWAAEQIFAETVNELVLIVQAAVKRLGMEDLKFDLVLSGSVIQNETVIRDDLSEKVRRFAPNVSFIIPKNTPAYGALKLALKSH